MTTDKNHQTRTRQIGEGWSGVRGVLQSYSTSAIKQILGKSLLPTWKIQYQGTYKNPFLDEADVLVRNMQDDCRNRFVRGCIEEIISFETAKNANCSKSKVPQDETVLRNLEQVLSRLGYGIFGKDVFPLSLQLDLETTTLPEEVSEAIAEALRRYRDGNHTGAITSVCGAVDKISERLFSERNLGDHKASAFQERVSKSFATLETDYCEPLRERRPALNEIKLIWENHKKAVSQAAYVLGAFRREYSDVHGEQNAPVEFVQKSLDCAVFILRSFSGVRSK